MNGLFICVHSSLFLLLLPQPFTFPIRHNHNHDISPRHGRRIGYPLCHDRQRSLESTTAPAKYHQQGSLRTSLVETSPLGMFWDRPTFPAAGQCPGTLAQLYQGIAIGNPNARLYSPTRIHSNQRRHQYERTRWCVCVVSCFLSIYFNLYFSSTPSTIHHHPSIYCPSELAEMLHGVDGAAASRESSVNKAGDLLVTLNGHRSERVATTLSGFPRIHWFLMDTLYVCILLAFLVDSNQEVNQYLNSIQVRTAS